ncbi:FimV/HubP family polar landmark protein [Pseudomonas baltica]|uniref:FimV/HubP family polar landmark protein n=1 Tax=Pseudomonas baltica TaxID=2762576 RepID=UPI002898BE7A|nr:FimV/HubP family polar landmark protein [Pseudomonas baltica]
MQERVSSGFGRVIPAPKVSLLAAMVAAGALFYSALAPALGLGEISLHSALNQPLNADIELVDAQGLDRSDLAVGLASADEYSRAGIDRVFFLNDLRFTPVFQGNRKFIHVSSVRPVVEPYLSFLVQVSRPGGQLLRDYTVLLDPAGTVPLTPASIPTGSAASADQGTDYTRAAASSSAPPPAPPKAAAKPAANLPATSENKRYTVAAGDTLWTVGKKLTAAGTPTPPNQLVRELRDLNPARGPLKVGQSLRVPDSAVLPGAPADQITPVSDASAGATPSNPGAPAANAQTPEQLTATVLQNQQLQQSLDDANARLQAIQQQDALKDKQLADLQARAGATPGAVPPAGSQAQPATPSAPAVSGTASAAGAAGAPPAQPAPGANQAAPGPAVSKPVPAPAAPVVPDSDDSWLLIAGALAAVLLLLAALLLARRRRQQQSAILAPELMAAAVNDDVVVRSARTPVLALTETQLHDGGRYGSERATKSEPTLAGAPTPAVQAPARRESGPATDALDGASIYIAYGRFNEALGILREGLSNEPHRTDLRVRMLEVLGQQGDAQGYAEQEALLLAGGYSASTLEQTRARYPKLAPAPVAPAQPAPGHSTADPAPATAALAAGVIAAGVAAAQALEREPAPPAEAQEQAGISPGADAPDPVPSAETAAEPDLSTAHSFDALADDFPDLGDFDQLPELEPAADPVPESFDEFQLNLDDLSLDADWGMVSPFDTPGRPKASAPEAPAAPAEVDHDFASNLKELPEVFEMPDEQFLSDFADPQLPVDLEAGIELDEQPDTHQIDQDALDNAFLDSFITDADLPELDALTVDFDDLERQQASAEKLEQAQGLIEQGDFSQASDLLLELLREGDDSCKHAARQLLSSIS